MGQRVGSKAGDLDRLVTDVRKLSKYPQLREIAEKLLEVLQFISKSDCSDEVVRGLVRSVEMILPKLPRPQLNNTRFLFDAGMINAFAQALDEVSVALSRMILPTCGEGWSHNPIYLPSLDQSKIPRVDLISFKGDDKLDDVLLLDYPWFYHELGHILMYDYRGALKKSFALILDKVVRKLKARSLADSPINKKRADDTIEKLESLWGLGDGQWSWAIEIASDVFALWTCGPSYLAAFDSELDSQKPDPYVISRQHPPYEIRSLGLMRAGSRLGWSQYTGSLRDRIKSWERSSFAKGRTNEYLSYANHEILDGAIASSLEMCTNLKVPVCDDNKIKTIRTVLADIDKLDFGVDLVIGAWLVYQELGADQYSSWQKDVVGKLLIGLRCDS